MSFERFVDSTMQVFSEQLDRRFVETGDVCDLGVWLQRFAFDVIGEITFSKRLGFLERAEDVDGITESIWKYFKKASPVSWRILCNYWIRCPVNSVEGLADAMARLGLDEKPCTPAITISESESYSRLRSCTSTGKTESFQRLGEAGIGAQQ